MFSQKFTAGDNWQLLQDLLNGGLRGKKVVSITAEYSIFAGPEVKTTYRPATSTEETVTTNVLVLHALTTEDIRQEIQQMCLCPTLTRYAQADLIWGFGAFVVFIFE
jgi:hypothetical protein